MYIFQLMLQRRGGTANAKIQFHVQFVAEVVNFVNPSKVVANIPVANDTAFARTFEGKISLG